MKSSACTKAWPGSIPVTRKTVGEKFTRVAAVGDIEPGKMLRVKVQGDWVVVVNVDHDYFAIADTCSHEDASLFKGVLRGDCIRCPLHGSRFNVRTGQPLEEPAEQPVDVYPVKVLNSEVYVGHSAEKQGSRV